MEMPIEKEENNRFCQMKTEASCGGNGLEDGQEYSEKIDGSVDKGSELKIKNDIAVANNEQIGRERIC